MKNEASRAHARNIFYFFGEIRRSHYPASPKGFRVWLRRVILALHPRAHARVYLAKADKFWLGLASLIICLTASGFDAGDAVWHKMRLGAPEDRVSLIYSHPADAAVLFIGTDKGLYRSTSRGRSFQRVLDLSGYSGEIRDVFSGTQSPREVFTVTADAVYKSQNGGRNWKKIYGVQDLGEQCLSVAEEDGVVYAGTLRGIRYAKKNSPIWEKFNGELVNKPIFELRVSEGMLYASTDTEIFELDPQSGYFQKIFDLLGREIEADAILEESDSVSQIRRIKDFYVDESSSGEIWVATDQGIFLSDDLGDTWEPLPLEGLPFNEVSSILVPQTGAIRHGIVAKESGTGASGSVKSGAGGPSLFAGTAQGVFALEEGVWAALYKGIEDLEVKMLTQNKQGEVFAATERGVYSLRYSERRKGEGEGRMVTGEERRGTGKIDQEPTIRQVQAWAIDYAEVSNTKIQAWRRAASRKALLPKVSFGLDRATTELYHWDTGANPDALTKGREFLDWDASVSWDFGELVWNPDQTSIDSRSKMMVELREDILSQVTRIYFERRRLLQEKAAQAEDEESDEIEMRIQELTALLDGFTGGKFSEAVMREGGNHAAKVSGLSS